MTGQAFLDTLTQSIAPLAMISQQPINKGDGGILITLSDTRQITAKRKRIKACNDQAELDAYVSELLS